MVKVFSSKRGSFEPTFGARTAIKYFSTFSTFPSFPLFLWFGRQSLDGLLVNRRWPLLKQSSDSDDFGRWRVAVEDGGAKRNTK